MKTWNLFFRYLTIGTVLALSACNPEKGGEEAPVATLALTLESTTGTTTAVTIAPDANTAKYSYAIGEADDMAAFEDGTLEGITNIAGRETTTATFSGLDPATEYTVFARAYNGEGTAGKVHTLVLTTAAADVLEVTIETVERNVSAISVRFTPSEKTESYAYAIGAAEDMAAFENGTIEGYTVVAEDVHTPKEVTFSDLEPDSEYTVFARATGADGLKGDVAAQKIFTRIPDPAVVTMLLMDRDPYTLSVKFTGNENTAGISYAIGVESDLAAFEAGTLEGIKTVDNSEEGTIDKFDGLEPGTTYMIFARGVNAFDQTGQTATLPVRTFDLPQVDMTVEQLNNALVTVKYTLNETSIGGLTTILSKSSYDNINTSQVDLIENILGMQVLGTVIMYEEDMVRTYYMQATPLSEYVIINLVIYTDRNGVDQYQINTLNITTPAFNPDAPTPSLSVEVVRSERYETELRFTTGEGTYSFQHSLLPKALYDMLVSAIGEQAVIDDLMKNGRIGHEGTSTYTYNHREAAGIKGNEDAYLFGILYGENGPGEFQIFKTFFIPAE